ncbi:MAG: hypothetical protein NXH82_03335 [Rhodobacteraceae bacterium]|nr:hypothetical protein [Paracoccaceae bacterium]
MAVRHLPHPCVDDDKALTLTGDIRLAQARVHEICGPARRSFATWLAARTTGPVIWLAPAWQAEQINPDGLCDVMDPARLLLVRPTRAEDLLWSMEEILRAGAVALVAGDLPAPPGLTAVRRMHLAAQTGAAEGPHRTLGLLLTPGEGGAPGVETRWHMAGAHVGDTRAWHLARRRARTRPPQSWRISPPLQPGGPWRSDAMPDAPA